MTKGQRAPLAGAQSTELRPVGELDSLVDYCRDVWSRRGYWVSVPADDLRVANRRTVLGPFWLLLNPAIEIFIYYLIFGLLLGVDRGLSNFVGFLTVGLLTFDLTARSLPIASRLMTRNLSLIRSLRFPRALLPLSEAVRAGYSFLIALPVMLVAVVLTGEPVRWQWVLIIPAFVIALVFAAGMILVVARLGQRYADLQPLVAHGVRLLFYMSGVLYDPSMWSSRAEVLAFFNINPFYVMNSLMRAALIEDVSVPLWMWGAGPLWAIGIFLFGFAFFRRAELSYGS